MSNTGINKEVHRGTGNGRSWRARGRGQANRGSSNPPLKGRTPTAGGHAQQSDAKPTATTSPSDAQTTRRRMNLMASVSRSSGLQKDGDE